MVELVGQDTPARDGLDVLAGLSSVAVDVIGRSFEFPFGYVFSFSFDKNKNSLICLAYYRPVMSYTPFVLQETSL